MFIRPRSQSDPLLQTSTRRGQPVAPIAPVTAAPTTTAADQDPSHSAPGEFGVHGNEDFAHTADRSMAASMRHEQHLGASDAQQLRSLFELNESEQGPR